jgi:hypothetical protein
VGGNVRKDLRKENLNLKGIYIMKQYYEEIL